MTSVMTWHRRRRPAPTSAIHKLAIHNPSKRAGHHRSSNAHPRTASTLNNYPVTAAPSDASFLTSQWEHASTTPTPARSRNPTR
jgi:hypothetical protein